MSQWEKITIALPAAYADIASEFIISATGRGVETDDIQSGLNDESSKTVRITAWLTEQEVAQGVHKDIERFVAGLIADEKGAAHHAVIEREQQAEEEWAEKWKEYFKPVRAGEHFIIRPHWESCETAADDIEIIIDPGQAFGVGTHASTALMLASMEQHWSEQDKGYSPDVLDIGTGTGILGIAACRLGAATVKAIDIDIEAIRAAKENAMTNGVSHLFSADTTPVEHIGREFELVLANIDKPTLTRLSRHIADVTRSAGVLMVSGILTGQRDHILKLFTDLGFKEIRSTTGSGAGDSGSDQWACVTFRRK